MDSTIGDNQIVKVELQLTETVTLLAGDMKDFPERAMDALKARCEEMLKAQYRLLRLTYTDDDGDQCTLTSSAVADALDFAAEAEDGVSLLPVKIVAEPAEPAKPVPAAVEARLDSTESTLLPEELEEPPAAPAEQKADVLPTQCAPTQRVPTQCTPCAPAAPVVEAEPVEVHPAVTCDECEQTPIIGARYKCLERHDYDLCQRCYDRNRESGSPHQNFCRVKSNRYVSIPGDADAVGIAMSSRHEGIICDVCSTTPIIGSRFKCKTVENYDLCPVCYEHRLEVSPHGKEPFEEMIIRPITAESQETQLGGSASLVACLPTTEVPEPRKEQEVSAEPGSSQGEPKAPEEEPKPMDVEEVVLGDLPMVDLPMAVHLSAEARGSSPLVLGVEAEEDEEARGDCTENFPELLRTLPSARQVYRVGQMSIQASDNDATVPAEAKVVVLNDGDVAWPVSTCLRLVQGEALGLESMELGSLEPGEGAEFILDLSVPHQPKPGKISSCWTLVDEQNGETFGPLLLFQVIYL